jgi:hypothetical protein
MVSASAVILRLYGIGLSCWGLAGLFFAFTMKPGVHGVGDWTRPWPMFIICVLLGIAVFLLLRWLVVAFAVASSGFGVFYIISSVKVVPFPWELLNIAFAILMILPAFLTYRSWSSLR